MASDFSVYVFLFIFFVQRLLILFFYTTLKLLVLHFLGSLQPFPPKRNADHFSPILMGDSTQQKKFHPLIHYLLKRPGDWKESLLEYLHESVMYEDTSVNSCPLTTGKYNEGDFWFWWFESYETTPIHICLSPFGSIFYPRLDTFITSVNRYIIPFLGFYLILIYPNRLYDAYTSLLLQEAFNKNIPWHGSIVFQENLGWSWYWRVLPWCATDFSLSQ